MRLALISLSIVAVCIVCFGCGQSPESAGPSSSPADARFISRSPAQSKETAGSRATESADFEAAEADESIGWSGSAGPAGEEASSAEALPSESRRVERKSESRDRAPESPKRQDRHIQSGTLTAGSFDDNQRFDDYQQFLAEAMQQDGLEKLPRLAIGRRVVIQVQNQQGKPVGNARVVVRESERQSGRQGLIIDSDQASSPVLMDLTTASDGRTMLLTGMDAAQAGDEFLVTVHPPDGSEPVSRVMHVDQGPWRIVLPDARSILPRRLDLSLVIDTTGSMGDELEYLQVEIESIAEAIYRQFPNVDQRYSLIVYRDQGDQYVSRTFDFSASLAEFQSVLSDQSANGGGDYPEAMHVALEAAGKLDWRDRDTARVLFLVADAPPHDRHAERTLEAVADLRKAGVRVFPVAASGTALKAEFVMRAAGFLTLGQYLFLTDHSGVGNPHAEPHVPDYQVERLDRLMIRMIASELSGKRFAADEVIAVEDGKPTSREYDQDQRQEGQQPDHIVSAAGEWFSSWQIPRWLILAAIVLGVFFFDSVVSRPRSG